MWHPPILAPRLLMIERRLIWGNENFLWASVFPFRMRSKSQSAYRARNLVIGLDYVENFAMEKMQFPRLHTNSQTSTTLEELPQIPFSYMLRLLTQNVIGRWRASRKDN